MAKTREDSTEARQTPGAMAAPAPELAAGSRASVVQLLRPAEVPQGSAVAPAQSDVLLGEVVEPREASKGGRALVRWANAAGRVQQAWASVTVGLEPQSGQQVMLSQPSNWPEPVVTGCLAVEGHASLRLQPGQCLSIEGADGQPLLELRSSERGPVLRFVSSDVNLQAKGTLRLEGERVELKAARGGMHAEAEGDTIVRGRTIQLN